MHPDVAQLVEPANLFGHAAHDAITVDDVIRHKAAVVAAYLGVMQIVIGRPVLNILDQLRWQLILRIFLSSNQHREPILVKSTLLHQVKMLVLILA